MKAYVCRMTGGNAGLAVAVTGEYKTERGLVRAARRMLRPFGLQSAVLEVFYNWERCYGKCDKSIVVRAEAGHTVNAQGICTLCDAGDPTSVVSLSEPCAAKV